MNLFRFKYSAFLSGLLFFPLFARAQTAITIDTSIFNASSSATSIQDFISKFYELGLGIAGIVAVGMIVVGSIYYTISGASPQKKGEAKDIIFSAVWGLVLLFGSYLILKSVNPELIDLKDPGSRLGEQLPGITSQGDCTTSTPYMKLKNPTEDRRKWEFEAVGRLDNTGSVPNPEGKDLKCSMGTSPVDSETGYCRCYEPDLNESSVCPGAYEPVSFPSPYPRYLWPTSDGGDLIGGNRLTPKHSAPSNATNATGAIVCPKKVSIEGEFYTIDCDPCSASTLLNMASTDTWGPYENDHGDSVQTTGWMWPYYPKDGSGADAVCLLFAHYDIEDKEIERSDLDGMTPCKEFSASTTATYSPGYNGNASQTNIHIQNPNSTAQQRALAQGLLSLNVSTVSTCPIMGAENDPKSVLQFVSQGYYPNVCSNACNCQPGGVSHTVTLSDSLLYGLDFMKQKIGTNIPAFRLTSLTGDKHRNDSDHYTGHAADITIPSSSDPAVWQSAKNFISGLSQVVEAKCEYNKPTYTYGPAGIPIPSGTETVYSDDCSGIYASGTSNQHIHIKFN